MAEDTLGSPNFDVWAMMMRQRDHNFGSLKLSEILDGYQRVGVAAPATGFLPPPAAAPTAAAALEPINGTGKEESTPIVQSLAMCGTQGDADRIKELFLGMGNTIVSVCSMAPCLQEITPDSATCWASKRPELDTDALLPCIRW